MQAGCGVVPATAVGEVQDHVGAGVVSVGVGVDDVLDPAGVGSVDPPGSVDSVPADPPVSVDDWLVEPLVAVT